MQNTRKEYLPAAGRDWALPLYDPIVKLLGADAARIAVLGRATIRPNERVLDIGCGTGTFATLIRFRHPDIEIVGLDPDPRALLRARRKAASAGVNVRFDEGFSDQLPYPESSFDHVFSTFMLHHLRTDQKRRTLAEVRRVLTPGGLFHLLDFVPKDGSERGWRAHFLHSMEHLNENSDGRILELLREAGFAHSVNRGRGAMLFGFLRTAHYDAVAPAPDAALSLDAREDQE